jgi:hypothetical protein
MEKEKKEIWNNTRFKSKIRIKPEQLKWIRENKNTKSAAGFLDLIINYYKRETVDNSS